MEVSGQLRGVATLPREESPVPTDWSPRAAWASCAVMEKEYQNKNHCTIIDMS